MKSTCEKTTEDELLPLDDEQQAALTRILETSENLLITGKAGTGKSFLLKRLLREGDSHVLNMAPTGVAAINIGGVTLHSAFGFDNLESISYGEISKTTLRLKKEKQDVLRQATRIIIDEASMIRADTFDKMEKILRILCKSSEPFAGKQIILFGDIFQLPPVVKNNEIQKLTEEHGGIHFFETVAYQLGKFGFIELTINHRQAEDERFFEMLNNIREGNLGDDNLVLLKTRVMQDEEDLKETVRLFPKKKEAEFVNNSELRKLPSREYKLMANFWSRDGRPVGSIEGRFPIAQCLRIKVGAQVMMTTNDPQKRWANGSMGTVEKIEREIITVTQGNESKTKPGQWHVSVRIGSDVYDVPKATFVEEEAFTKDGAIGYRPKIEVKQFPMVLAWAVTIHKSQGLTYDSVACELNGCFAPGQAYVALSRCKSLAGLHLFSEVLPSNIIVDDTALAFYRSVRGEAELSGGHDNGNAIKYYTIEECHHLAYENPSRAIVEYRRHMARGSTEAVLGLAFCLAEEGSTEAKELLHEAYSRSDIASAAKSMAVVIQYVDKDRAARLLNLAISIAEIEETFR